MRILLDENFPRDFAPFLQDSKIVEVHTVHSLGWAGTKNGELLRQAATVCDVFVTLDRNLQFQQNIARLPFGVILVRTVSNRMVHLKPLATEIMILARRVRSGEILMTGFEA